MCVLVCTGACVLSVVVSCVLVCALVCAGACVLSVVVNCVYCVYVFVRVPVCTCMRLEKSPRRALSVTDMVQNCTVSQHEHCLLQIWCRTALYHTISTVCYRYRAELHCITA